MGPQQGSNNVERYLESTDQRLSVCGNCGAQIPSGNYISHTTYCYRENYRCSACKAIIPQRDRDAHLAEWTEPSRLFSAMEGREVETLQLMIEHGADVTAARSENQGTLLHIAARLGDAELIGFLIGNGFEDVSPRSLQGETPLHCAVESGNFQAVRLLVELGADLNPSTAGVEPPLMLACRRGLAQAARLLVEMRADLEVTTPIGDTALDVARTLGHQDVVMALATVGAPLRSGTPTRRARSNSPHPLTSVPSFGGVGTASGSGSAGYPPLPPNRRRDSTPKRPPLASSGRGSASQL